MSRSLLVFLTFLVAATTLLSPLHRDLFVGDETKYGRIVWEMRETGSLLVPPLEGRPYTHKPPLHFWFMWALTFPFGTESMWPYVIPSLVGYGLLIWLTGVVARRLFGGGEWLARFAIASFWLVWGLAQTARMDVEYTVLITAGALFIWRWLEGEGRRAIVLAGAAAGLAILIKGPMALVILLVLLVAEMRLRKGRWSRDLAVALLVAAAIPLAWVIPAAIAGGEAYSRELLIDQNVGRAVSSWTHAAPPWFYLAHFPVTFLPWSFVTLPAIVAVWTRRDHFAASRFCVAWFVAVLVPFSLLSGKLDVYMLPAMVPLALLVANWLRVDAADGAARWGMRLSRLLVVLFGGIFVLAITLGPRYIDEPEELALVAEPLVRALFWATGAAAVAGLLLQFVWRRPAANAIVAALVSLFPLVFMTAALMPVANRQVTSGPLVREIARVTTRGSEIGLYGTPHLWAREIPGTMREAQHLGATALAPGSSIRPRVLAVRRDKAAELGPGIEEYERVGGVTLKGKEFDVLVAE